MKRLAALGAAAVMVMAMAAPAVAARPDNAKPADKVWVCHATHSGTNPWVIIRVSETAWLTGHSGGGPALHQNMDSLITPWDGIRQGPSGNLKGCFSEVDPF